MKKFIILIMAIVAIIVALSAYQRVECGGSSCNSELTGDDFKRDDDFDGYRKLNNNHRAYLAGFRPVIR